MDNNEAHYFTRPASVTLTGTWYELWALSNDLLNRALYHHESAYATDATPFDTEYHNGRYQTCMNACRTIDAELDRLTSDQ